MYTHTHTHRFSLAEGGRFYRAEMAPCLLWAVLDSCFHPDLCIFWKKQSVDEERGWEKRVRRGKRKGGGRGERGGSERKLGEGRGEGKGRGGVCGGETKHTIEV